MFKKQLRAFKAYLKSKFSDNFYIRLFYTNRALFILLILAALLPLFGSGLLIYILEQNRNLFADTGGLFPLFFFGISVITMSVALTPTTLIAVMSGYFFSWYGILGVVPAYMLAVSIGYVIAGYLYKAVAKDSLLEIPRVRDFVNSLKGESLLLVIFARLSPVLPSAMMNVVFSALKIAWPHFLTGSLLGMFPRTFLSFWTGMNVRDIGAFLKQPDMGGFMSLIPFILVVISTLGIISVVKKAIRNKKPSAE
jgi:uncharacterized membrane protein YdjX (TVP38/TMEM64 family)